MFILKLPSPELETVKDVLNNCHEDGFEKVLCAYLNDGEYTVVAISKNRRVYCMRVWGEKYYYIDSIE